MTNNRCSLSPIVEKGKSFGLSSGLLSLLRIRSCDPHLAWIVDVGYHGAISKFRNFSGWKKNITNQMIIDKWGNAKTALPRPF